MGFDTGDNLLPIRFIVSLVQFGTYLPGVVPILFHQAAFQLFETGFDQVQHPPERPENTTYVIIHLIVHIVEKLVHQREIVYDNGQILPPEDVGQHNGQVEGDMGVGRRKNVLIGNDR